MTAKRRDPRRPDDAVPFTWPEPSKDDASGVDAELIGLLAMTIGMYGLFTQWRVASWVSLFFGIVAQVNTGRNPSPAGGGMNAIIFSVMALMISLANQFFPHAFSGTSWFGAKKT